MDSYLKIGKTPASLNRLNEVPVSDALIANEDHPGLKLRDKQIKRAIWANMALKGAEFVKCDFSHTIFVNCYFRGASLQDCDFTGCKFVDCNFAASSIIRCQLPYSKWEKTDISRSTLLGNLPTEANLAQKVLIQLRLNASSIGEYDDARHYLYEGEKRSRTHFIEIMKCRQDYYRGKYALSLDRLLAPFRYLRSLSNKVLWGYGERPLLLSLWGLVFVFGFGIIHTRVNESIGLWEGFKLSLGAFVSAISLPIETPTSPSLNLLHLVESLFGLVYIAFLAASLHRRVSTRRD